MKTLLLALAVGIAVGPAFAATINAQGKSAADAMLICQQIWRGDDVLTSMDKMLHRYNLMDCMGTQGFTIDASRLMSVTGSISDSVSKPADDPAAYQVEESAQ